GAPAAPVEVAEVDAAPAQPAQPPAAGAFRGQYAEEIIESNKLPTAFNRNNASALRYHPESTSIESGDSVVTGRAGGLASRTRVDSIYIPPHQVAIRMKVTADSVRGILGQALNTARSAGGVWITDDRGQQHRPIAYALHKGG